VLDLLTWSKGKAGADLAADGVLVPVWVATLLIGTLVVSRRPGNRVGLLLCMFSFIAGVILFADGYATYGLITAPGSLPGAGGVAWLANWVWLPGIFVLLAYVPLVFPDGNLASRRWRWAAVLTTASLALLVVGFAFQPGELDAFPIDNPLGIETAETAMSALISAGFILLFACLSVTAASVVVRYRRSTGVERLQLKWLVSAAALVAALFILGAIIGWAAGNEAVWNIVLPLSVTSVVAATGVAVLRYRLYEIDRIVNRTVVYGLVSALLAGLYFGIVLGLQQIFSGFAGGSDLAIAGSTLAVAALFRPARGRIQAVVDRRFYRNRYDAQRTLEAFSARLRDEVELDALRRELLDAVTDTMQPSTASLWLRDSE
jgi:hypothetical protein